MATHDSVVGREAELSALGGLVDDVLAGRGGIGWVEGEPGIGKTTVVDRVAATAHERGCRMLRGAADPLQQAFPLRLVADALEVSGRSGEAALAEIADLLRGRSDRPATFDPVLAAAERVLDVVDRWCTADPVVLLLEDLHWADEPSLLLFNRLAHSIDQIPLLLLGTCRPSPRRDTVTQLRAALLSRGGTLTELGPLPRGDVLELARRWTGASPGPILEAQLARAGGNPLYLTELLAALTQDKAIEVTGEEAELRAHVPELPGSLQAAIGHRLAFLSDKTVSALRLAALLTQEFEVGIWARFTGREISDLAGVVAEATSAAVVADMGRKLAFRHSLIREALAEQIPRGVRVELHRQAAKVLMQANRGLDDVAPHLLAAGGRFEEYVLDWLTELPESALYAAPDVSAQLLAVAVEQRPGLAFRLAYVLFWLGRDEEAIKVAKGALGDTSNVELAARLRILVLRSLGRRRRFEEALRVAEPDPGTPAMWCARLEAWAAMILAYQCRFGEAGDRASAALDTSAGCGDGLGVAYALHTLAFFAPAADQVRLMDEAVAALPDGDPEATDLKLLLLGNRLHRLLSAGRRAEVEAAVAQSLVLAEHAGTIRSGILIAHAIAGCYCYGRWDDALTYADSMSAEHRANPALAYLQAILALIALQRDDRVQAEYYLRAGGFIGEPGEPWSGTEYGAVSQALALYAEAGGDLSRAFAVRRSWLDLPPGPQRDARCDEIPQLVRLAMSLGDGETALAAANAMKPGEDESPDVVMAARCAHAMLDASEEELRAIAGDYHDFAWPHHEAFALEELAALLAAKGAAAQARAAFHDAIDAYAELGATWDIRRIEARLRQHGIRRGPKTVQKRATHGWEALTPGEKRVAELVGLGLSNPDIATALFLSRNTVQTHVSHILTKLQMRSRAELIRALAKR